MRVLLTAAVPVTASLALAFAVGILTAPIRAPGPFSLWLALLLSAIAAGVVAAVAQGVKGFILGAVAGSVVLPITLLVKLLRWPDAPILGEAGDFALAVCAVAAIVGAVVGTQLTTGPAARR